MITRRSTFFLGIFIFLIPFLGLPTSGITLLMILSGLTLIWLSIKVTFTLPQRHGKPIAKKPRNKKEKNIPITIENISQDILPIAETKEDAHETNIDQA